MPDYAVQTPAGASQAALCGFRRCRAPLPPPGPRGGRPYEFCPDRVWPSDKTCKQLAAAEQALRDALGNTGTPTALEDAGDAFTQAAARVTEPLQTLSNALDTITARLQKDITAAVAQAEAAEQRAADADQHREAAQARAARADQARQEAEDHAHQAEQATELAETTAAEAVTGRAEAELAQARAEAATAAITQQAEKSANEVTVERARAESMAADLATRTEELAVRTTERDATRAALSDLREHSRELERALTEQNTHLAAELDEASGRLRDAEDQHRAIIKQHQDSETELRDRVSAQRADLARQEGQLEAATVNTAHLTRRSEELVNVLSRVRHVTLGATGDAPGQLRDQLLATLLDDHPAESGDASAPGLPATAAPVSNPPDRSDEAEQE
jgi:hypothetical protein